MTNWRRGFLRLWLVASVIWVAVLGGVAVAGPLDDALAADKRGDYVTALRLYRPLAELGDARAQYKLGLMYSSGDGVPQDYVEAVKWYRSAADQNFIDAQDALARVYFQGRGVPVNYVQAHMWANLAASHFSGPGNNLEAGLRDNIAAEMTQGQINEAQRLAREWRPK